MNKINLTAIVLLAFAPAIAQAELLDGGWRISAGAVYDSGVKTRFGVTPQQSFVRPTLPGTERTQESAKNAAWYGTKDGKTKTTTYNNERMGLKSVFSPETYEDLIGDDSGLTDNYRLPKGVWMPEPKLSVFQIGYAEYDEIISAEDPVEAMSSSMTDESAMPGINVELSRNLWHDAEYGWGLDAAFAVQYFRRNHALRGSSGWRIGTATRKSGSYSKNLTPTGDLAEMLGVPSSDPDYDFFQDLIWHSDAGGEYTGAGADGSGADSPLKMPGDDDGNVWSPNPDQDMGSSYGSMNVDGDYENLELMLLARPYYDVYDWLRINGTLGVVVSRQSMEMSFSMFRDGEVDYRSNRDFSQWDVYGVGGLGLMLYYKDFTLSADFMARFLDEEMMIEDLYYRGSVRRGRWMFKLSAGYEF